MERMRPDSAVARQPSGLRPEQVQATARSLVAARTSRRLVAHLPFPPSSLHDAYAIQDAVAQEMGSIGGWKVGAKGPAAQPTCAPLFAGLIYRAPAVVPAHTLGMIGIEAEIAFRLDRGIAPGGEALDDAAVAAAIGSIHPAIEIVDTRLANWREADPLTLLADNSMNAGFVHGAGEAHWRGWNFLRQPVRLTVDGKTVAEAIGGNPAGDPCWLVTWLVNHCRRNGIDLAAGTFITTGSCTGMIFVAPEVRVEADFPGLGRVQVAFPA